MGRALSSPTRYADLSLWHSTADDDWTPRAGLDGDLDVDVAIVGAGFTGLWTAYYLASADPGLRIAVLEAEVAGFGASGRNGGWASALFPASLDTVAAGSSRAAALDQHQAMRQTLDEIERVTALEGIDAWAARGGTVVLARSPSQLARAREEVAHARTWDRGPDDVRLLDEAEARGLLDATHTVGGTYTPDCLALHPARLVRGIARAVEARGVRVLEQTRALDVQPREVRTERGVVRADHVVLATEGYTPALPGRRRAVVPVYSLIIATEPLPPEVWEQVGLHRRETFSDHRHLIVYGQRTADDRMVFGGRGAPYHWGSRVRQSFDREPRVFDALERTLVELFPVMRDVTVRHRWGGPLGIARDWTASVGLDRSTGMGWAGGYVGDGVSTTNLAGRTLADLITGRDSDLVHLPWVGHRSRRWEPEPLRWWGINAGLRAMTWADREEERTGRPSRIAKVATKFMH